MRSVGSSDSDVALTALIGLLILLVLIVTDLFVLGHRPRVPGQKFRGALVGLASAIKLTPLVFLGVFAAAAEPPMAPPVPMKPIEAGFFSVVFVASAAGVVRVIVPRSISTQSGSAFGPSGEKRG